MSFESFISTDPKSQARLYASSQLMAAHLAEKGINITPADFRAQVESLPTIKLCCLMEDALDVETAEMQIRRLPGVENQARLASLKIALQARTPYAAS